MKDKLMINQECWWLHTGDAIKCKIIALNSIYIKVQDELGGTFGRMGLDGDIYTICRCDIATTREEAIRKVSSEITTTRLTLEAWRKTKLELEG